MWIPLQILAVAFWGMINVLDSLLVKHYERNPIVMLWYQNCFSLVILAFLWIFFEPVSPWIVPFLLAGVLGYLGDIVFFLALDRVDVSVTNIAWVLLSVFLSLAGFLLLGETWSLQESLGAVLVVSGIVILSVWHRRVSNSRSLLLLPLLGLLYVPFYLFQEQALLRGAAPLTIFFWLLLGREASSFLFALLVPRLRRTVLGTPAKGRPWFHVLNGIVITLFFAATYLTALAFQSGPLSLVSVVGNVQPFFVLFFAWVTHRFVPSFAPREILSTQSVSIKLLSFVIVFLGLTCMAFA